MDKTVEAKIRIDRIELLEKTLPRISVTSKQPFKFDLKVQVVIRDKESLVIIFTKVDITKVEDANTVASVTIACGFFIENFNEIISVNESTGASIPVHLDVLLRSISISTVRGVMFSEFRGTQLHEAILPVILTDAMQKTTEALI